MANSKEPGRAGRKRDASRDAVILDSALQVLAEHGYDAMTVDMVAAHCAMARATVYRRWPTKTELVLAAVSQLSHSDVDLENLPDTGSLRGDLVAMIAPFDERQQHLHVQAVVGLLGVARTDERLARAATRSGIEPWVEVNRHLIRRAIDRGEFSDKADVETLAEVVPMLCLSRAAQRRPIDTAFCLALIDEVVIPALRGI